MQRILKAVETLRQNYKDDTHLFDYILLDVIEKEVKEYQEIAEHYGWNVITSEIADIRTPKKYRDLFFGAILDVQRDYCKARALEIVKNKNVDIKIILTSRNVEEYNYTILYKEKYLTPEEYNQIKKAVS